MPTDDGDAVSPDGTTQLGATIPDTSTPNERHALVLPDIGYDVGEVIGRGGMGEVVSAHDRRIGRDVAIKRMRAEAPSNAEIGRFLREARIQARLDHPAIVPVHELGLDPDGRPYFTMKRLAGVTLAQRLAERAPTKLLLRALVDVCLAIEFAHARGIVHRDLKPSNIMLGEYGEVYVLDWGIATVMEIARRPQTVGADIDTIEPGTQTGDLIGTPGYMSPEQVRNLPLGAPADVYALGAILFEILVGESLHSKGTAALASTLTAPQQAPSSRVPDRDIAPELDAACFAALAQDPAARPTARELADRIQHYLDGDRDVERRRVLADELLASARAAIASGDPEARAVAMNRAGRALALDPESDAAEVVSKMLIEPPRVLPAELVTAVAEEDRRIGTERMRFSLVSLVAVMTIVLLLPLMEVRSWTTLALAFATVGAVFVALWVGYVRKTPHPALALLAGGAYVLAFSRVLGPFVLTPVAIAGALLPISASTWLNAHPRWIVGWLLVVALAPLGLEWIGVFQSTWSMVDGGVCSTSAILEGRSSVDGLVLVIVNLVSLGTIAMYGISLNRRTADANRQLFILAWHLGQLLPAGRIKYGRADARAR